MGNLYEIVQQIKQLERWLEECEQQRKKTRASH